MAFITGQASTLQGLLDALATALAGNGWANSGNCWSKNGCCASLEVADIGAYIHSDFFETQNVIRLVAGTGVSSGALVNPAPYGHGVGDLLSFVTGNPNPHGAQGISFPASYSIHINTDPDEIYFFINYNIAYWQWLAFGKSPVPGLPGTGNWAGGTMGVVASGANGGINTTPRWPFISISPDAGGGGNGDSPCAALMWDTYGSGSTTNRTSTFHHDIKPSPSDWEYCPRASAAAVPRIQYGLADWNQDAVLLPIRPITELDENKNAIIGELAHARYLRIDNYAPGQIITLGQDKWRVYPWYHKNSAERDGGADVNHTGTFGVALRYDGA